jgi:hypothetical protein
MNNWLKASWIFFIKKKKQGKGKHLPEGLPFYF